MLGLKAEIDLIFTLLPFKGEEDVVSLLFYFVVVYSIFRVQMVKQCFAHILQRRICLNPSQGSADGSTIDVHPSGHVGSRNPQLSHG